MYIHIIYVSYEFLYNQVYEVANEMTSHLKKKVLDQDCPLWMCEYQISFLDTFVCTRSIETVTLTDCLTVHSNRTSSDPNELKKTTTTT